MQSFPGFLILKYGVIERRQITEWLECAVRRQIFLPLPKGEGRGEGEGNIHQPATLYIANNSEIRTSPFPSPHPSPRGEGEVAVHGVWVELKYSILNIYHFFSRFVSATSEVR